MLLCCLLWLWNHHFFLDDFIFDQSMQYLPKNPLNNFDQLFSFAQSQTAVVSSVSSCYFGLQVAGPARNFFHHCGYLCVTLRMPQDA